MHGNRSKNGLHDTRCHRGIVSSSRVGNIGTPAQTRLAPTTPRSAANKPGSIQSEPAFSKTRGRKLSGEIFGASDLPQFLVRLNRNPYILFTLDLSCRLFGTFLEFHPDICYARLVLIRVFPFASGYQFPQCERW